MTDRTQKNKDRKNEQRRKHAEQARKNRVLIEYIEKVHPQIHKDACEYYQELEQKYPRKLDLRRTVEFEMTCHNTTKRRTQRQKRPGKSRDNMVLTIPLIPQFKINQPQSDQTTPPQSDQTTPPQSDQTTPPQSDQTTPPQSDQTTPQHQPDNMPQHQPDNMPFPMLTNEVVDEIIRDLQQSNPGFEQWFEDIDTGLDIDIDIEDISPLEVELS